MRTFAKGEFKARMLEIMREIEATGESVVVTDHGRPCVLVEPYAPKRDVREVFGDMTGQLVLHQDPDLPTTGEWNDS